jgi:hypothetical protein
VAGVLAALLAAHLLTARDSEPYFNNDETRHTMTGVFFADACRDLPASVADPKGYAVRYYCQYPALGVVTWPPFFYAVEGLAMLLFGPHFLVGRVCVAASAAVGLVYSYRFARLMLPHPASLLVLLWTALTPVVFEFSQRVMLEVPTFAFVMAAVVHFEKYLAGERGRDAVFAGLLAAGAVLTRFDGAVLALYFGLRLIATRKLGLLLRRPVLYGALIAALFVVPYYALTLTLYGSGLSTSATTGTGAEQGGFSPLRLVYYPLSLPDQAGWTLTIAAAVGLPLTVVCHRRGSGPVFALLLAVYLLFSPLAEHDPRHAVYWLPAVAVCAVRPVAWLWGRRRWATVIASAVVTLATAVEVPQRVAFRYVFGYEDAARWVVEHHTTDRPVLMDGELVGSFVFHARKHDPERRVWVMRGDKTVYNHFSDPATGYRQYVTTEAELLAQLEHWDPEFVVVEDPPPTFHRVDGSELLLKTLRANSGEGKPFEVVHTIPIRSNYDRFTGPGAALVVHRKTHRNPNATNDVRMELIGLGRTVGTTRP